MREETATDSPYAQECRKRLAQLPAEISAAQHALLPLARQLGEQERCISSNLSLVRARKAGRNRIHLVRPTDPEVVAQTSWRDLCKTAAQFTEAMKKLEALVDERERLEHSIAYAAYLDEYLDGLKNGSNSK